MVDKDPTSKVFGTNDADAAHAEGPSRGSHRIAVRLTAIVVVLVVSAGLFEGLARIVFAWREEIRLVPIISRMLQRSLVLDPYEMPSPKGGFHWVLRPGYEATLQQLVEHKRRAQRTLGARTLENDIKNVHRGPRRLFRINSDGFKGPELDHTHSRPRILMLGDSTTFGIGDVDYPRVVENWLTAHGISAEVINGGVEGYSPRNILIEIDRYKALKPEIVTLYIGWNALYSYTPWTDAWENRSRLVWLVRFAYRALRNQIDAHAYATELVNRTPKPNPDSPWVKSLDTYVPPFMNQIERIVDELTTAGSDVVLMTLPGLLTLNEKPTPAALKIAHLPSFTENPYVLAKLTGRYNTALRLLARGRNLFVIDLASWSDRVLQPRTAYFLDSVHLTTRGLKLVGAFIAEQLAARVESLRKRKPRTGNR